MKLCQNRTMDRSEKTTSGLMEIISLQNTIKKEQFKEEQLSAIDLNRVIEMAWEDRTPFDAIKIQFGLAENEVKRLMKSNLKFSSYVLWRQRVESCQTKHLKKRIQEIDRFKCSLQRNITLNKISKRKKR